MNWIVLRLPKADNGVYAFPYGGFVAYISDEFTKYCHTTNCFSGDYVFGFFTNVIYNDIEFAYMP